ncbi:hypothetical protein DV515_00018603, partial [Chloebia gouldiae]
MGRAGVTGAWQVRPAERPRSSRGPGQAELKQAAHHDLGQAPAPGQAELKQAASRGPGQAARPRVVQARTRTEGAKP